MSEILHSVLRGLDAAGIQKREAHRSHQNHANPKYGVQRVKGKLVDNFTEQRTIQAIKDLREQGLSCQKIAQCLTRLGIPTRGRGKRWNREVVRLIAKRIEGE